MPLVVAGEAQHNMGGASSCIALQPFCQAAVWAGIASLPAHQSARVSGQYRAAVSQVGASLIFVQRVPTSLRKVLLRRGASDLDEASAAIAPTVARACHSRRN